VTPEEREEATARAYRDVLDPADARVRLIIADLAAQCHVGATTLEPGDPHVTARNEGQRSVFLYLAGRVGLSLFPET
jgi:hypothetical protein